jgi:hypothetical protein
MFTQIKHGINHVPIASLAILLGVLGSVIPAKSSELGHYAPAILRPRDFSVPPPGFYASIIQMYYAADTIKDKNGNKIKSVEVDGETISVDVDLDSFVTIPIFTYVIEKKVLGANYGFMIAPSFGNVSLQSALESQTNPEFGLDIDESGFGLGDAYVRPVWLGWNFGQVDLAAAYSVYVPIGKFEDGEADNVGLGMWTHEFQLAGTYYLGEQRGTALSIAGTYEIHHNKRDVDIRPGSHFSLNYGVSQFLPVTETVLGELSIFGTGQWQVTEDRGSDATNKDVKDQVYGLGLQGSLTYLPWGANLSFHWLHEFEAEDRFEGDFFFLSLSASF